MRHWHAYIEKLDDEIDKMVEEAAEEGLDAEGEEYLHCLFENRKHAMECLKEKEAGRAGMTTRP